MNTAQRIFAVMVAAASLLPACNRAETDERARRAAEDMRYIAARTGDQLADSWLTAKIQAQYFADDDVKARFINVSTRAGVVTLKGRVDSEAAHEQAVQIAKSTDGVRQVTDQLIVWPARAVSPAGPSDANWITTQIQARFFAHSAIDGRDIDVNTRDGVVTLSGRVDNEREKELAVAIARDIEGVGRVDDRLTVQELPSSGSVPTSGTAPGAAVILPPRLDDARITTNIQAKYFLDNGLKGRRIQVDTKQGVVTRRGEVASDNERAQALLLARTTEGAERVEDNLTVNAALAQPAATSGSAAPAPATTQAQSQDAALTEAVKAKFSSDARLKGASIDVTTKDGVVLLEGTVLNNAAKQRALTFARETKGVLQVVDRLAIQRVR
jgi:osmotically-inducible protein OsmY